MNTNILHNQKKPSKPLPQNHTPLKERVTQALQEAGHPDPAGWLEHMRPEAETLTNNKVLEENFVKQALCRALRETERHYPELDTMDIRMAAGTSCPREAWVKLFKEAVAPVMAKNPLPAKVEQ